MHDYIEAVQDRPIIAAVQNRQSLERALDLRVPTIFLINTDIFSAKALVDTAKKAGTRVFLHMDLIDGLATSTRALEYVQSSMCPSGIISTRTALVKYARDHGIFAIQRFFMLDSASYENAVRTAVKVRPSMIELMPGIIPSIIKRFTQDVDVPVIAGGLITTRRQVIDALSSGAIGVSTGQATLWTE